MPPLLLMGAAQGAMGAFGGGGGNPQLPSSNATATSRLEDSHDLFAGFKQGALEAARTVNQNPTFGTNPFISTAGTGVNWTMLALIGVAGLVALKFFAR